MLVNRSHYSIDFDTCCHTIHLKKTLLSCFTDFFFVIAACAQFFFGRCAMYRHQ